LSSSRRRELARWADRMCPERLQRHTSTVTDVFDSSSGFLAFYHVTGLIREELSGTVERAL